jgi:hypothetical protein
MAYLAVILATPQGTFAWGREGHEIIVIVAEHYMRPETAARMRELLGNERLRLKDERPPGVCDRVDIQLLVGYDARYGLSRTRIRAHEPSASY